ncbi:MAG TPA: glycosyltransferase family 1 protein, partial [Ferruginibacter sp.]|nr:glycosyltransferase family 1 protein [Ferruginibacter sp.]
IDPADLPVAPNIHYLGGKSYSVLPEYLSGWNIAMIPFEKNESTRFISPTKTPEYLAAARPVVSASIEDVVNPYGERGLVHIADSSDEFIKAVNKELARSADEFAHWLKRVDGFMKELSWDNTTAKMEERINECLTQLEADKIQNKTGLRSVA